jgi:hypothetical protein
MFFKNFVAVILLISLFSFRISCQESSYNYVLDLYSQNLENQKVLYNGFEHVRIPGPLRGHPYYNFLFLPGSVNYYNEDFTDIFLVYDVYNDEVIFEHRDIFGNRIEIQLFKNYVRNFILDGHYFLKISQDTMTGGTFSSGFYEVLYNGDTQVFLKHIKLRSEEIDETERKAYTVFTHKKHFVIYLDGKYYSVKKRASAFRVFREHKHELMKFYRESGFKFRNNPEKVLAELAQQYDKLVK